MILARLRLLLALASFIVPAEQSQGAPLRATTPFPGDWKIQPASAPDRNPQENDWGHIADATDWRTLGPKGRQGTTWAGLAPASINSLWLEKDASIPAAWQNQRVILDFPRIEGDAIIFWNGQRVSELLRPGGEVDVTPAVNWTGPNILRVFLTRDYTGISRKFVEDPLRYTARTAHSSSIPMTQWGLGITAPVTLSCRPPAAVTDVFCIPSWQKKTLTLEVETTLQTPVSEAILHAVILDADGKPVLNFSSTPLSLPAGHSVRQFSTAWADPIGWELDRSYLYRAQVSLEAQATTLDRFPDVTFGFREIWTDGRKLMMNGHPSRWRLTDLFSTAATDGSSGAGVQAISLYRLIGYNVGQIQPNPGLWWRKYNETPMLDQALLDEMDRVGMGCTAPALTVNWLRNSILTDERAKADYRRETASYFRRYRNHPCILAWSVAMNSYATPKNITPQGMGRREVDPPVEMQIISAGCDLAKQIDPTRLYFGHADGSVGDISTANTYLNFVPLQEREEWPMAWAKDGDMPFSAVEFGEPFLLNFWKGKQFLPTEYFAIYLGDEAYRKEGDDLLSKTLDRSIHTVLDPGSGKLSVDFFEYPAYADFQNLFTRNTNRAWRSWGVNAGWMYWLLEMAYGNPPSMPASTAQPFKVRYLNLPGPVTGKPAWANPNFDIYQQANKPLLVYLGGAPAFTDKTHGYASGEAFQKQIVAVWDGPGSRSLSAQWSLLQGDQVLQSGTKDLHLEAGDIVCTPLDLSAPASIAQRTDLTLNLSVTDGKNVVATDTLPLQVFPPAPKVEAAAHFALDDPAGKSAWVRSLGVPWVDWKQGDSLQGIDVLVIGREALKPGQNLPYPPEAIEKGLRVIILEQKPEVWEGMGFKTIETMPRYLFPRDLGSPVLAGLSPEDLVNWRGAPDLLPEGKLAREYDAQHAPKWTNRHAVASVAIQIPQIVGFTPILQTEFDLAYSPLLEWRYGKGEVYYSSLDLTDRVGSDPAATRLAVNLLSTLSTPSSPTQRTFYSGGVVGRALLSRLQAGFSENVPAAPTAGDLLVIGDGDQKITTEKLAAFTAAGGSVFYLPQPKDALQANGFATNHQTIFHAPAETAPLLRAVGPGLLRWRDSIETDLFSTPAPAPGCNVWDGGILLSQESGAGRMIHLQVSPDLLSARYATEPDKQEAIQLSVVRLAQLVAQILTNAGASPSQAVAERLSSIGLPPVDETLGEWKVLGPYPVDTTAAKVMMSTSFPGEEDAITGAQNPNLTYKRPDGVILDWRKVVQADENGYVDLAKALKVPKTSVAYVTRTVTSDIDRRYRLRLGVDYWLKAWVNGQPVLDVTDPHRSPAAAQFMVEVPLHAGNNTITLKLGGGSGGFGFWSSLARVEAGSAVTAASPAADVPFYLPLVRAFDPYQFTYW